MRIEEIQQGFAEGRITKADYIARMFEQHQRLYEYTGLLEQCDIASIEIQPGRLIYTARNGVKIASSRADQRIAPVEILNFAAYEPQETAVMLQVIQDGDVILDIGANIGWYSLSFARQFPRCRIHAFEPLPPLFDELTANLALNGCSNVSAHNIALSDDEGELSFFYDPVYSSRSSSQDLSGGQSQQLTCRKTTLDLFAESQKLPPIRVIKCDVEGAELLALRGGMATITRDKPAIFAEMLRKWSAKFGYHPNEIIAMLAGIGYSCFDISAEPPLLIERIDDQTAATNFLFLHPATQASWIERWTTAKK